jgi:hypothetical protein
MDWDKERDAAKRWALEWERNVAKLSYPKGTFRYPPSSTTLQEMASITWPEQRSPDRVWTLEEILAEFGTNSSEEL